MREANVVISLWRREMGDMEIYWWCLKMGIYCTACTTTSGMSRQTHDSCPCTVVQ